MKPKFQILSPVRAQASIFFAAITAFFALGFNPTSANARSPVPLSISQKLDEQLLLVVQKSSVEATANQPTSIRVDVYQFQGRVLVQIDGALSKPLADEISALGGQLVTSWGTSTTFRAWIPFGQLETLASQSDIKFISAARPTVTRRFPR